MTHTFQVARLVARFRAPLFVTVLILAVGACDTSDRLTEATGAGLSDPGGSSHPTAPLDSASAEAMIEDSLALEDSLASAADPSGGRPIADEDDGVRDEEDLAAEIGVDIVEGPDPAHAGGAERLFFASAFRGGIPFGTFHLPKSLYGRTYTGTLGNISPNQLVDYLQTARRNGARVMVTFSGNEKHYKNSNRSFSLSKWKQRVNRFRGINLSSYIKDGTLIGHYLIDEPHDPANWGGRTVSRAYVDEMAKYSKQLWPGLPAIARAWPEFLKGYRYRYLDAAWAQYSARFGSVSTFLKENVRDAKASGLALVVGMNQLAGGDRKGLRGFYSGRYAMSASQLRSWGATMLADSYPCAFISWEYNSKYMNRSDIKSAQAYLAGKARSKGTKSCKKGSSSSSAGGSPSRDPVESGSNHGSTSISLTVSGRERSGRQYVTLRWSGLKGSSVDVYRNGTRIIRTGNDGYYVNVRRYSRKITYEYKTCAKASTTCSKSVKVSFR